MFSAEEAHYKAVHGVIQRFMDFYEVVLSSLNLSCGVFCLQPSSRFNSMKELPSAKGRFIVNDDIVAAFIAGEDIFRCTDVYLYAI